VVTVYFTADTATGMLMAASAVHCHYFASHPCQTVPHIYILSCIHHKIQIQNLFYQRSLRVGGP